jgi:DNA polymerase I-like protein with 3'-5' exonuclease and polymerase domains
VDQKTLIAMCGPGKNPFPGIVLEYRSLSSMCNSTIARLELPLRYCVTIDQDRLLPNVDFRTATGRVKFTSPNLQNLPKEIAVTVRYSARSMCLCCVSSFRSWSLLR